MNLVNLNINFAAVLPEIGLTVLAIIVLILDLFMHKDKKRVLGFVSVLGLLALLPVVFMTVYSAPSFGGMVISDLYSAFFNTIFIIAAIFTILISSKYLTKMEMHRGEYYYITLFATLGMMVMASSNDFISLYVGLELMALSFYVLVALRFDSTRSVEGALKYFILGALSSGILLYGISFAYGITGTTNLAEMAIELSDLSTWNSFLFLGIAMIIVGFAFKIAVFPFHVWAPDTYEGAPTPVTALLSVGSKAAAFAVFLRVFIVAFPAFQPEWSKLLWILSAATMLFGSVVAISQKNIIRMLAYSSIAHAGIILIGLLSYNEMGLAGIMYYLLVYVFMNMGIFAVVIFLVRKDGKWEHISDYKGLATRSPLTAFLMALFLVSLAGIPPTGGFLAKFYIFASAINAHYYWLAVIGVIATVISLFFYARVIFYMYMKEPDDFDSSLPQTSELIVLFCAAIGTIFLGVYPAPFIDMAIKAVRPLLM